MLTHSKLDKNQNFQTGFSRHWDNFLKSRLNHDWKGLKLIISDIKTNQKSQAYFDLSFNLLDLNFSSNRNTQKPKKKQLVASIDPWTVQDPEMTTHFNG